MMSVTLLSKFVNMWDDFDVSLPATIHASASCCAPLVTSALTVEKAEPLAQVFKALGDPTRLRLLSLIAAGDGGEACICDLTTPVGLSQGTVSHHMRLLADAGLVTREQRGKWAYFTVETAALDAAADALRSGG